MIRDVSTFEEFIAAARAFEDCGKTLVLLAVYPFTESVTILEASPGAYSVSPAIRLKASIDREVATFGITSGITSGDSGIRSD